VRVGKGSSGQHRRYCGGVGDEQAFPVIRQTVLDTTDPRRLAEFYRQLFGLRYRPGDEPPGPGRADPKGQDWLVLRSPADGAALAFQKVGELAEATWPDGLVPQQLHLDTTVPTVADLDVQHERALALGARLLEDRSADPQEPLRVYADPAGHPFCIFVAG
jgi:catechol 2,3-dioxygenase-like lactoylglutathione lyase family enzyme